MSVTTVEQERINDLVNALISFTPEKFKSIDCIVEQVPNQCSGRHSYKIGCQQFPDEGTTNPNAEVHTAAYEVLHCLKAEGLEINLHEKDQGWTFSFKSKRLNNEEDAQKRKAFEEELWQKVYDDREAFYIKNFGEMPADIQKLMTVLWPGGGMWDIERSSMDGKRVMLTCGLSNPDMPTGAKVAEFERVDEGQGKKTFNTKLERKVPRFVPPEWAGYGYEVALICANEEDNRAMAVLTWIIESELNRDADILGLILKYGGLTVQDMGLFDGSKSDFLFYQAMDPIQSQVQLPNGLMHFIIGTRITRAERDFAKDNSCGDLIKRLQAAGVGQTTDFQRKSVV